MAVEVHATFFFRRTPDVRAALAGALEEDIARVLTSAGFASVSPDDVTSVSGRATEEGSPACLVKLRLSGGNLAVVDVACREDVADAILVYLPQGVGCEVEVEPASARV